MLAHAYQIQLRFSMKGIPLSLDISGRIMTSESELFRLKYEEIHSVLHSAGTDTEKLTNQLYSCSVVGPGVRDEVCDAGTPSRAASMLLRAVETRIKSHPQDIWKFVNRLSSFSTWEDLAEEMRQKLEEMESQLMQPQPASDDTVSSQQSLNIRLFISPTGEATVHPVPAQSVPGRKQSKERVFELRSAPPHRRQPQTSCTPPQPSKPFPQASSPLQTSSQDLESPDQPNATSTTRDDPPANVSSEAVRRSLSTVSQESSIEEEVGSMKESLGVLLDKHCRLKDRLHEKDREAKALQQELATRKEEHETEVAAADQERKILKEQVKTLEFENDAMKNQVEEARKSVAASNQLNHQLVERQRQCYAELKRYQDRCSALEEQLKEATKNVNFLEEYHTSEERAKDLERELGSCKETITRLKDKVELLEMEIEIFAERTSLSSCGSTHDFEQEGSGGFGFDSM